MDVYHKVLAKLYEAAGGKESQVVDFKDLVKRMSFHGNYEDIFDHLSREGWIAESKKANFVSITHWGIAEVKKAETPAQNSDGEPSSSSNTEAAACAATARELALLLENLSSEPSDDDLAKLKSKFGEFEKMFKKVIS